MPAFPQGPIGTGRLLLTPLGPGDADEMAEVLADPELHRFIGGHPATLQELRDRYRALEAGPPRPDEVWRNWIVRRRADARSVGTVQATIGRRDRGRTAEIAWVVGLSWQGQGYASEAARALVAWLGRHDVHEIVAHIHPGPPGLGPGRDPGRAAAHRRPGRGRAGLAPSRADAVRAVGAVDGVGADLRASPGLGTSVRYREIVVVCGSDG